jgi:hypothetical protein
LRVDISRFRFELKLDKEETARFAGQVLDGGGRILK